MKTYLLLIGLLITSFTGYAQLTLSPQGLVASNDEAKPYVVYTFKGLMQDYLYSRMLPYVKEHFNQQDNIIEEVPRQILIEGKGINRIGLGAIKGNIIYRLSIGMEDGKVGYDVQQLSFSNADLVEQVSDNYSSTDPLDTRYFIFDKNGQVHVPELKQQVEDYFNDIINRINTYIRDTANVSWDL